MDKKLWILTQWWRWQLSGSVLNFINFLMLSVALSPALSEIFHVGMDKIVLAAIPAALFITWFVGYLMDRARYAQGLVRINYERDKVHTEIIERLKNIEKKIEE
jgi:hypothetical protein